MAFDIEEYQPLAPNGPRKKLNQSSGGDSGGLTIVLSSEAARILLVAIILVCLVAIYLSPGTSSSENDKSANAILKEPEVPFPDAPLPQPKHTPIPRAKPVTAPPTAEPTPEPTTPGGKFGKEQVDAVRKAAKSLINLLDEYYGGREKAVTMLQDKGWASKWTFEQRTPASPKDLKAARLVDTMARALVSDEQEKFIIGTIGSSVAAGHDNCNYDSYERQLERTFQPIWEAAGMKLEVQNAGEGGGCGDSHANQVFCIKQNVSPFVDIIHYSWTYFGVDFNSREQLIRWAQMMPRQPPVHYFNARGQQNCVDGRGGKPIAEDMKLLSTYELYGYNKVCLQTILRAGGHDYEADKEKDINRFGWRFVGDGYHNTTRYGENEAEVRRKSLGVVFRNWHPGPLGFQAVADAMAYTYSNAVLQALDLIEQELDAKQDPRNTFKMERPVLLKHDLPDPLFCDPMYCSVDEAPGCLNFELPTYGWWGARVDDPNDDFNPYKGQLQNWTMWLQNRWDGKLVAKEDVQFFKEDPKFCKHLDSCGGIEAEKPESGMVVFKLPKMEVGLVVLCACCGKKVAERMLLTNEFIEVQYNKVKLSNDTWEIFPNKKCVKILSKFPTNAPPTTGHSYLSVKILEGNKEQVRISHVITL